MSWKQPGWNCWEFRTFYFQLNVIKSVPDTLLLQKPLRSDLKAETKAAVEFICIKSERLSQNASFKALHCSPPHTVITLDLVCCVLVGFNQRPLGGGVPPRSLA